LHDPYLKSFVAYLRQLAATDQQLALYDVAEVLECDQCDVM